MWQACIRRVSGACQARSRHGSGTWQARGRHTSGTGHLPGAVWPRDDSRNRSSVEALPTSGLTPAGRTSHSSRGARFAAAQARPRPRRRRAPAHHSFQKCPPAAPQALRCGSNVSPHGIARAAKSAAEMRTPRHARRMRRPRAAGEGGLWPRAPAECRAPTARARGRVWSGTATARGRNYPTSTRLAPPPRVGCCGGGAVVALRRCAPEVACRVSLSYAHAAMALRAHCAIVVCTQRRRFGRVTTSVYAHAAVARVGRVELSIHAHAAAAC